MNQRNIRLLRVDYLREPSNIATLISDIYRTRLRYLSRSSQISVSTELDIIPDNNLYSAI